MDDLELIRRSLRAVLEADGTSAKALAAKAQAARQLALLSGHGREDEDLPVDTAPDPMEDLDELEAARQRRARRQRASGRAAR